MGCNTCKQSNQNVINDGDNKISLIPENLYDGSFLFKVIAFFSILIAVPFILLVLVGQIFLSFFFPKSLPKVMKKFKSFFMGIFIKYAEFKSKRMLKKREREFNKTKEYISEGFEKDIEEVEIYDNESRKDG